ncbi:unnamed protein product [Caenorhabditis bovis]|uniref:Uncharacterized protein n=1 Tax=Caenorhabditis bovis TaxID=2654633 RepID=A0A8S1EF18_9PELO|nr:unnamed protein product [Caenorhabditis bovis]
MGSSSLFTTDELLPLRVLEVGGGDIVRYKFHFVGAGGVPVQRSQYIFDYSKLLDKLCGDMTQVAIRIKEYIGNGGCTVSIEYWAPGGDMSFLLWQSRPFSLPSKTRLFRLFVQLSSSIITKTNPQEGKIPPYSVPCHVLLPLQWCIALLVRPISLDPGVSALTIRSRASSGKSVETLSTESKTSPSGSYCSS